MAATNQNEALVGPAGKVAAAVAVLLVGLGLAMMFRRDQQDFRPTAGPEQGHLVLREQGEPVASPAVPWRGSGAGPEPRVLREKTADGPPGVLAPQRPSEPPPSLAREYPETSENPSRWGTSRGLSMEMLLPRPAESSPPRRHAVVDGDTLPGLARRYLGSPDRYFEIYEANRDVLPDGPDVLPIGAMLKIPAK